MRTKCRDCGCRDYTPSDGRSDVCVGCFDLRELIVRQMQSGGITASEFGDIQSAMRGRVHRAAGLMRAALKKGAQP